MNRFRIRVAVKFKEGVLDPQGETIKNALVNLGYNGVSAVSTAKLFILELDAESEDKAVQTAGEMAAKLLANPVIEQYAVDLQK